MSTFKLPLMDRYESSRSSSRSASRSTSRSTSPSTSRSRSRSSSRATSRSRSSSRSRSRSNSRSNSRRQSSRSSFGGTFYSVPLWSQQVLELIPGTIQWLRLQEVCPFPFFVNRIYYFWIGENLNQGKRHTISLSSYDHGQEVILREDGKTKKKVYHRFDTQKENAKVVVLLKEFIDLVIRQEGFHKMEFRWNISLTRTLPLPHTKKWIHGEAQPSTRKQDLHLDRQSDTLSFQNRIPITPLELRRGTCFFTLLSNSSH